MQPLNWRRTVAAQADHLACRHRRANRPNHLLWILSPVPHPTAQAAHDIGKGAYLLGSDGQALRADLNTAAVRFLNGVLSSLFRIESSEETT